MAAASLFSWLTLISATAVVLSHPGSLAALAVRPKSEWLLYDSFIEDVISDYQSTYYLRNDTKMDDVFVEYLGIVLHRLGSLSDKAKSDLFPVILHLLPEDLDDGGVSELLNIALHVRFGYASANPILERTSRYADQLSVRPKMDRRMFWVLTATFERYAKPVSHITGSIQRMHLALDRLEDSDDPFYWYHLILSCWRLYREKHPTGLRLSRQRVDQYVKTFAEKAMKVLATAENVDKGREELEVQSGTATTMSPKQLREGLYIGYVRFLVDHQGSSDIEKTEAEILFKDLYEPVSSETVFQHQTGFSHGVTVSSQTPLSSEIRKDTDEIVNESATAMESFKTALNTQGDFRARIEVFLFDSRNEYKHYVSLWNAQIHTMGVTISVNESLIQIFVFKEKANGGSPHQDHTHSIRNLGHELIHAFTYNWLGPHRFALLPSWFVEGMAEALGNPACHRATLTFSKRPNTTSHASHHTIRGVTHLEHTHGLDVYYFGSYLFRYLYDTQTGRLETLLQHVQEGKVNKSGINGFIGSLEEEGTKGSGDGPETAKVASSPFLIWLEQDYVRCRAVFVKKQQDLLRHLKMALVADDHENAERLLSELDTAFADLDTVFEGGNTLLHYTVNGTDLLSLWGLLQRGANAYKRNDLGQAPRDTTNPLAKRYFRDFETQKLRRNRENNTYSVTSNKISTTTTSPSDFEDSYDDWDYTFPTTTVKEIRHNAPSVVITPTPPSRVHDDRTRDKTTSVAESSSPHYDVSDLDKVTTASLSPGETCAIVLLVILLFITVAILFCSLEGGWCRRSSNRSRSYALDEEHERTQSEPLTSLPPTQPLSTVNNLS